MDGGTARRNLAIPVGDSAGEGVEKVEGLTIDRFVALEGWGTLVDGRLVAPREHGRGSLRSGGAPVLEWALLVLGGWGGRVGLLGGTGPR
jgi:hypothetical protein